MTAPTPLSEHLAWLQSLGCAPCSGCEYGWRSLGRLYGTTFGHGWVRLTTARDCPEHGPDGRQERAHREWLQQGWR
jgi:hypothetical protein